MIIYIYTILTKETSYIIHYIVTDNQHNVTSLYATVLIPA